MGVGHCRKLVYFRTSPHKNQTITVSVCEYACLCVKITEQYARLPYKYPGHNLTLHRQTINEKMSLYVVPARNHLNFPLRRTVSWRVKEEDIIFKILINAVYGNDVSSGRVGKNNYGKHCNYKWQQSQQQLYVYNIHRQIETYVY